MTAGPWNLIIKQGSTFREGYSILDETGALLDLSSCTAKLQIRRNHDASDAMVTLTTGAGITLGNGVDQVPGWGEEGAIANVLVVIDDDVTETLSPTVTGVWDIEIYSPNGETDTPLEGDVMVKPQSTR